MSDLLSDKFTSSNSWDTDTNSGRDKKMALILNYSDNYGFTSKEEAERLLTVAGLNSEYKVVLKKDSQGQYIDIIPLK